MSVAWTLALVAGASLISSALLTGVARRFALSRAILDVPNERSSHSVPTPRGGGIALVGVVLATCAWLGWSHPPVRAICIALGGGGALVAAIGWLDDRRAVPARFRLLVHLAAAAWAVGWLGGMERLQLGPWTLQLGLAGSFLAVVGVAWLINLYNFMDGIDGIAGSEAVVVGGFASALLLLAGDLPLALLSAAIASAAAGFLFWNWPPARIFMGDVGSGTLGFLFAVLAVASENRGAVPSLLWVLLLFVFIFDATVTLARRIARGEPWYSAHRSHAYQRATQGGLTHLGVTLRVIATNLLLGMLALAAAQYPAAQFLLFLAGACLLALLYVAVERLRPM